jgi:hypothetical protein
MQLFNTEMSQRFTVMNFYQMHGMSCELRVRTTDSEGMCLNRTGNVLYDDL